MKTLQKIYKTSPVFYFCAFFCFGYTVTNMLVRALKKQASEGPSGLSFLFFTLFFQTDVEPAYAGLLRSEIFFEPFLFTAQYVIGMMRILGLSYSYKNPMCKH